MAKRGRKTRGKAGYMISAVAEMYNIHPQTLRLYEREGLLIPSRSNGNTRLYAPEDLEQLETILNLTRDLGVNLAGIEIILNMRRRMRLCRKKCRPSWTTCKRNFCSVRRRTARNPECPGAHRSAANHSRSRWLKVAAPPPPVVLHPCQRLTNRALVCAKLRAARICS